MRYDDEKVVRTFHNRMNAQHGTALHELSANLIRLKVKLPKTSQTLNMYVNDAIGLHMTPEQMLVYSINAFGTADAISFGPNFHVDSSRMLLRIHDLKTGEGKTGFDQLKVYAAFFCLEYDYRPEDLDMEFRIYQDDIRRIEEGDGEEIRFIMNKIVHFDSLLNKARLEVSA